VDSGRNTAEFSERFFDSHCAKVRFPNRGGTVGAVGTQTDGMQLIFTLQSVTEIDPDEMVMAVMNALGHWRKPKSLEDARKLADTIIDNMDPEWLLRFGLSLLGVPEATDWVLNDWTNRRRPPLRDYVPYFVFMLTINLFFCLVMPAQLLRNVKPSHKVDLAYLYYLPFCSVFTSKDNFHAEVVPLFLTPEPNFC
jgi:hypothetical protein